MKKFLPIAVVILLLSYTMCPAQQDEDIINITGTINHFSYEGGFYGIAGDDGTNYKPVRLTSSYQTEGVRVRVKARLLDKKLVFGGWGKPIDILNIERIR